MLFNYVVYGRYDVCWSFALIFFSLDINANVILCKFYIYLQRLYMFFKKNTIYNVR